MACAFVSSGSLAIKRWKNGVSTAEAGNEQLGIYSRRFTCREVAVNEHRNTNESAYRLRYFSRAIRSNFKALDI